MFCYFFEVDGSGGLLVILNIFDADASEALLGKITVTFFITAANILYLEDSQVVSTIRL